MLSHERHKTYPKVCFLACWFHFQCFYLTLTRQSQILTPIWTGKQSDDFGRSPFSIRDVAVRKSVQKNLIGTIFVRNWRPNQKYTFLAGSPYPPQKTFYDSGPTRGTKPIPKYVFLHADSIFNVFTWLWREQSQIIRRESKVTILVGRHFQSGMLPFERAFKKTWLGHIFVRNWRPNQKCTFLAGLPYPPQKTFYDSGPTRGTKPIPKYVFLHADSIFNVFTWLWRGQSQILTPIWTGKQSYDFGRSPFSIRNVAFRKSV